MLFQDGTYYKDSRGHVFNYGERWEYGYIVGIEWVGFSSPNAKWNDNYISNIISELPNNTLFGIWTDDAQFVYLDLVKHVDDYNSAMELARANKERAIWDLRAHKSIDIDY